MNKYDVFGLSQLIDRGLSRQLELIENAINQLDAALEPITILESFAFVVNTQNAQLYRMKYDITEGIVTFSEPTPFLIEEDVQRYERQSKKIVRNIIEALADDDDSQVEFYKTQMYTNERQRHQLQSKLNLSVGSRSQHLTTAKKVVGEAVSSVRGAKSLIEKGRKDSNLNTLLREGSITIAESNPVAIDEEKSNRRLTYTKIVEARKSARSLTESPLFVEYVYNIYEGIDADEAIEFIAENYQELFTLSLSEQTELFYAIVESKLSDKPELEQVVESITSIGKYAAANEEISRDLAQLSELIGAQGNFHERMQLIEDEINTKTYTQNDIKILMQVLEAINVHPSEFLAPEFVVEARRIQRKVKSMLESGNIDDAVIAAAIHLVSQFYPQPIGEGMHGYQSVKGQGDDAEYEAFFRSKLEKWGINDPQDLDDEQRQDFFKEIEDEWTKEDPATDDRDTHGDEGKKKQDPDDEDDENADKNIYGEGVDPHTGFPAGALEQLSEKSKKEDDEEEEAEENGDDEEVVEANLSKLSEGLETATYDELCELEKQVTALRGSLLPQQQEDADELLDRIAVQKLTVQ